MAITKRLYLFPYLFIILLGLFTCFSYLLPGLPQTDDGAIMVIRSSGFAQSLKDGHFPVRWIDRLNETYGYPVANFLYPLPFYLSSTFDLLGLSALSSIKLLFIITTIIGGFGMYLWAKHSTSTLPALIAASLYTLAPYHLTLLYQRGSIGENTTLAIIPFIFYFIDRFYRTRHLRHLFASAFTFALLILAHNSQALIFFPLVLAYFVLCHHSSSHSATSQLLPHLLIFAILALTASAFFWLPALHDLPFTRAPHLTISHIKEHFVNPLSLLSQIGLLPLGLLWAAMGFLRSSSARFWILIATVALIFQIPLTLPVWQFLHLDRLIQFPFRFLTLFVVSLPFLSALLLHHFRSPEKSLWFKSFLIVIVVLQLLSLPNILSFPRDLHPADFYLTNFSTTTNQKEFTPITVIQDPTTIPSDFYTITAASPDYRINFTVNRTQEKHLQIAVYEDLDLTFNTHYFPGWQVLIDDAPADFHLNDTGTVTTKLTPPNRTDHLRDVTLIWQETPLRQAANLISLLAFTLLLTFFTYYLLAKNYRSTITLLSLFVITLSVGGYLLSHLSDLTTPFNPITMEQKYLNSQWVNPTSTAPLGDHGLYSWAGWAYIHGQNPILINSEMPPLGKYLIGIGLLLTAKPGLIGLFFSLTFLTSLFFLARHLIHHTHLALIPVALISLEPIFQGLLTHTMLDAIQLTFLCLAFLFLLHASKNSRYFLLTSLMLGGVLSTKFYATGVLVITSIIFYYLITKQFRLLRHFSLSLPLAILVHLLSYLRFFQLGYSLPDYLGVQKYIFTFYLSGTTTVPVASYWLLVFANRWRVWWGPTWGQYYTLHTSEWLPTWPLNALAALVSIFHFLRQTLLRWTKKVIPQPTHLLTSWLIVYSLFLTAIGGWPHYLLLFLPFSSILLIQLFTSLSPRHTRPFIKSIHHLVHHYGIKTS